MSFLFPGIQVYGPSCSGGSQRQRQSFNCGAARRQQQQQSFNPFLSILDETFSELQRASQHQQQGKVAVQKTFNPRFDVSEVDNTYVLEGEVPGVEQSNLSIEFLDEATLQISGHRESAKTAPTTSDPEKTAELLFDADAATLSEEKPAAEEDSASTKSRQPTVEEETEHEQEWIDVPQTSTDEHARPTSTTASPAAAAAAPAAATSSSSTVEKPQLAQQQSKGKAWVSERSHGSFTRTFRFEQRIARDDVSAQLKNGVLSIIVPKAPAPEVRRINIE